MKLKQGTYVSVPERIQIPENINEQFIVELYSKIITDITNE